MQALYPDTLAFARPPEGLEASLDAVERHLCALGAALRDHDAAAIDQQAGALHRALAAITHRFSQASRQPGGVTQALRQRLAMASGQVAAQRESLARATAALDRAIDVLMPTPLTATTYGEGGHNERSGTSACLQA